MNAVPSRGRSSISKPEKQHRQRYQDQRDGSNRVDRVAHATRDQILRRRSDPWRLQRPRNRPQLADVIADASGIIITEAAYALRPTRMSTSSIVRRAFEVFRTDAAVPPPLTLRGGNAVDGYSQPTPFDPVKDEPADAYLEGFAFWGLGYLDARSWRHYLPRLIDYALRCPDDPAMVIEALVRTLRPPDRYPPRLATLTPDQEDVVRSFLEYAARDNAIPHVQAEARQALEEWWLPNPRCRPTEQEIAVLRSAPVDYHVVGGDVYQLSVPVTFAGSGIRVIPEESRRVQTWGGYLCGDAHSIVAVNVTPLDVRSLADSVRARATLLRGTVSPRSIAIPGSPRAERLDSLTHGDSPAEPQTLAMVFAVARDELVTLSIRSWPRADLDREVERMLRSFEIVA
jgi:hypothetical protein